MWRSRQDPEKETLHVHYDCDIQVMKDYTANGVGFRHLWCESVKLLDLDIWIPDVLLSILAYEA